MGLYLVAIFSYLPRYLHERNNDTKVQCFFLTTTFFNIFSYFLERTYFVSSTKRKRSRMHTASYEVREILDKQKPVIADKRGSSIFLCLQCRISEDKLDVSSYLQTYTSPPSYVNSLTSSYASVLMEARKL